MKSLDFSETTTVQFLTEGILPNDNTRFRNDLSGGCLMDVGSYNLQMLRQSMVLSPSSASQLL